MQKISFDRHRFPPDLIVHAVWLYAKFTLSLRDVQDLLAERGLDVSYETVRRWFLKFGGQIARNLRTDRPVPSDHWYLDEMVIVIRGKKHWLWRAVDNEGTVLDFLVQSRRNAKAAKKLMRSLLKKHGFAPMLIVTDKLWSYHAAFRELGLLAEHIRQFNFQHLCPSRQASLHVTIASISNRNSVTKKAAFKSLYLAPVSKLSSASKKICKARFKNTTAMMIEPTARGNALDQNIGAI